MKPRPPRTVDGAVTRIMGALSPEGCEAAVGKSQSLIRKWGDPDSEAQPNIEQALKLDIAFCNAGLGDAPILAVYQQLVDQGTQGCPRPHTPAIKDSVLEIHHQVGELSASVLAALKPESEGGKRITPAEKVQLSLHLADIRAICGVLETAIEQNS